MLEHNKLRRPDDYFLPMDKRPDRSVFFYRISGYNKETDDFILPEKQRIEYIDALRGFTMILVVIHHVALFMWGILGIHSIHGYLMQVRMPMFYFISGFVLYKAGVVWNLKHAVQFLRKKFVVQIVSI